MLLDKLLLQIVRNKLVACKLGCKRSSTACQATQRDRVVAQFLQRNLGLKLLITSLAVHTHNQGAASLKVAHHVAHIVGRHINLEVVYRLKNLRTSLLESCRERVACRKHERELVRVNWVHLAVVHNHSYVACVAARKRTMLHAVHNTLQYGRHKAGVDSSANNRVDEDQLAAPFKANLFPTLDVDLEFLTVDLVRCRVGHSLSIRLYNEMHLSKLSGTTRLFLVSVLGTCHLCNGFAIRNACRLKLNLQLLVVLQAPLQGSQVEFALASNDGLSQLLALFYQPCWVFLVHSQQRSHQFLGLCGINGLNSARELRVRIFDEVETPFAILSV